MKPDLLLGIDVGTTLCKAAVVTAAGEEIAHGQRSTPWTSVPTGAEIDPKKLADAAIAAAVDAAASVPEGHVLGIGVTSMGETGVPLDEHGEPMAPGIAWHDSRGVPEAERLASDIGEREFTQRTGLPIGPSWTIVKYAGLRATIPEVVSARRWLSVAEWVTRSLGGDEVAELSLASRTGLLDIADVAWWPEGLDWAVIPSSVMPPLVLAGTPAGRVTAIPELRGAVVTVAGHDQPCGAVGAGATGSGDTLDSCGTAEAILRGIRRPIPNGMIEAATSRELTAGCHVLPDQTALLGFFKAGLALKRFLRLLGTEDVGEERDQLDREASAVPLGADGLVVRNIAENTAAVTGVGSNASRGALWRAAIEATARQSAVIVRNVDEVAGRTERLVVAGGWIRSEAYRAIKQEVQGPFDAPDVVGAAARGAALFGGLAAGLYASVEEFPRPPSGRSH
jgi:sugar (pentulose or hexulose) kinase